MKSFSKEELAQYNGQNGEPVYIAHKGNVYDVSESKLWKGELARHSFPCTGFSEVGKS